MRPQHSASLHPNEPLDIREIGAPTPDGNPQTSSRRLFLQLHAFAGSPQPEALVEALSASSLESVLYEDLNDPTGVGVLLIATDPADLVVMGRELFVSHPFSELRPKPELTMIGRTYSTGREPDLEDWLLSKPRRNVLNPALRWAIWYPLRRKPEFYLLPPPDQGKILAEHGMMGRAYAEAGYANDIRLACFGLDQHDNEFVIGLVGAELYPLSRLVQDMRKTQQTAKYIDSLGPFFVGQVCWQSPMRAD